MYEEMFDGWETQKTIKVEEHGGTVRVILDKRVYMSWASGDEGSRWMAIVQLYTSGLGTQDQLAEAFGVHVNSVQKYITAFARDGIGGLVSQRRGPRGKWKLTPRLRSKILTVVLGEGICGVEAVQQRLRDGWHEEVSLPTIRQVLRENGLIEDCIGFEVEAVQGELFDVKGQGQLDLIFDWSSAENISEARAQSSSCEDKGCRQVVPTRHLQGRRHYSSAQRAYLDRLEQGDYNAYAGGLLFAPLLEGYGFLPTLKRVIRIPTHEGYSFDELCLTLFYYDVFGFQSMEDFKRAYPEEFGVLIGGVQSPSVFTLRRFLHKVMELGKGEELIEEFGLEYLKRGRVNWGVMYIDGHFLPYYGVYPITMGWHGVRQIPMKGSYNFLAVDEKFHPWLFLIRSSSEDLLQKIPELIEKAKRIGEKAGVSQERLDNLIVLFDREGYSAELYRYLDGKDEGEGKRRAIFISWAKYADRWVNELAEEQFDKAVWVTYEIKKPEEIKYFETERRMNKYGKIRTIVIQSGKEKKRAVIFSNGKGEEINAERIVQLMCCRWGEENRIKELMTKHMINYMPGYVMEGMEEQPLVDNPKVKELKKKRARLLSELRNFKVQFADEVLKKALDKAEAKTIKAEALLPLEEIVRKDNELLLLNQQLDELPAQVPFDEAHDGRKLLALNYEKKRFLDCIKVFTCNIKEIMCRMLLKYYDWPKEIQPALSMIVERGGDLKLEGGNLRVRLRRFRNPEIDYGARHLCEELNNMGPITQDRFRLRLRYEVL